MAPIEKKKQARADPPESAPNWKFGDHPPAKPPVAARIDFEGLPIAGQAEVTVLRLPAGDGPLYEDELDGVTTTSMMEVVDGKLTVQLENVVEDNVFSIAIGPQGTRKKQMQSDAKWSKAKPKAGAAMSERELHKQATAKAERAAKAGVMRVNCGAWLGYIDPAGNAWFADRAHAPGGWGYMTRTSSSSARREREIAGTTNPEIYRTERWAMPGYKVTIANGNYLARLHFAETYGANRKFNVTIEGQTVLKDFNPLKEAGALNKAFFREFTAQVTDGVLDIDFIELGIINAIEVIGK